MKYRQLGRTGLRVSELCLGTMTLGGGESAGDWRKFGGVDQDDATRLIDCALEAGINFIDTADVYGHGESERIIGKALRDLGARREDLVIATKTGAAVGAGPNDRGASRGHIMDSVARSLERLQVDHIDLYQIHANDDTTRLEETLRALNDLVRQGMVRYAGVSNWRAGKLGKALGLAEGLGCTRIETVQAYYSLAGRDAERELVPLVRDEKLGLLVWSPLAGGLLSGKFGPDLTVEAESRRSSVNFPPVDLDRAWRCIAAMRAIAEAHDATVAQVALAWLLHKPHVTSVIIGARKVEQLRGNVLAADLSLQDDELTRLDEISQLPPEYPGWMIDHQARPPIQAH